MNNLVTLLPKLLSVVRTRNGLLVIVGLLLLLNVARLLSGKHTEMQQAVESKQALLVQYRKSTRDIEAARGRVQQLEAQKSKFEAKLFHGESVKDVTSAMQIKLQDILSKVGMSPESISPVRKGGKDEDNSYGEVSIKIRLGGTLDNFIKFMAELYTMNSLFRLENVTIKPFKKEEIKVFLEVTGYYLLSEPPKTAKDGTAKKEPSKGALQKKGSSGSGKAGDKKP